MIDFRYHIISLVAIFLALGVGILLGSATFGQNITKRLRDSIENVRVTNEQLREENGEAQARIQNDEEFATAVEPSLLDDALLGQTVVVFEIEGGDSSVLENSRVAIESAGGSVTGTVALTPVLALEAEADRAALQRILRSSATDPEDLRSSFGRTLGLRAAAAAAEPGGDNLLRVAADRRFERLLGQLQQAGFLVVGEEDRQTLVGPSTGFLLAGGSATAESPFETDGLSVGLVEGLTRRGAGVMAAQPRNSLWGPASAVRSNGDAASLASSVDQADITAGRIAVALGLDLAAEGAPCHYGSGPDASCGVIPEPTATGS